MGYRKSSSDSTKVWSEWLKQHKNALIASAVPSFVFDNLDSWNYFVDHGYVEDDETGFVFKIDALSA